MKYFFFILCAFHALLASPESQIVIIENFISTELANELISFYNTQKKDLNRHSDNQLLFSKSTDPRIQEIVSSISNQILRIIEQKYDAKKYHTDHCAMYSRITGNFCGYHSDNIRFECPIHGSDQGVLRRICTGHCPGAQFVPNHTSWRDYTALLYLNEDFEGGEILFEDGPWNRIYQKVIPIQTCKLVITPNGPDFYHEVFPIRSGKRYSLHFWYTSHPRYRHPYIP